MNKVQEKIRTLIKELIVARCRIKELIASRCPDPELHEMPTSFYTLRQLSKMLDINKRTLKLWHEAKLKHPHKYLVTYNEGASGQLLIPVSEYKRIRDLIKSGELKTVHKNKNREGA